MHKTTLRHGCMCTTFTFNSLMCTNWTTLYSLAQTESCLRDTSQSMAYLTDWSEKILTIMSCDGLRCLRRLHRTLFSTPVLVNGLAITILNWWMEWLVSSEHFHIHTLRQLQTGYAYWDLSLTTVNPIQIITFKLHAGDVPSVNFIT